MIIAIVTIFISINLDLIFKSAPLGGRGHAFQLCGGREGLDIPAPCQPEAVEPGEGGLEGVLLLPGEIEWEDLTVRQSA